jgi:hypothetical protein
MLLYMYYYAALSACYDLTQPHYQHCTATATSMLCTCIGYGQPPLSYYVSVLQHKKWKSAVVVTEHGHGMHPFAAVLPAMFPQLVTQAEG